MSKSLRELAEEALSWESEFSGLHELAGRVERKQADVARSQARTALFAAIDRMEAVEKQAEAWVAIGEDGYRTNPVVYCGQGILKLLRGEE